MPQIIRLRTAPVNTAAIGSPTIIAAATGLPITIWQALLTGAGSTTVTLEDNAGTPNVLLPATSLIVGVPLVLPYTGAPWFTVLPGNALVLVNSAAIQVSGVVYYTND